MTKQIISEMEQTVLAVIQDGDQARQVVYALLKRFGGDRIYLPMGDTLCRNEQIRELARAGVSPEQIITQFRISKNTYYRIVNIQKRRSSSCVA